MLGRRSFLRFLAAVPALAGATAVLRATDAGSAPIAPASVGPHDLSAIDANLGVYEVKTWTVARVDGDGNPLPIYTSADGQIFIRHDMIADGTIYAEKLSIEEIHALCLDGVPRRNGKSVIVNCASAADNG